MLAHGQWFSPGTPASSTTKTGRHDISEILLKVTLNTKNQSINESYYFIKWCYFRKLETFKGILSTTIIIFSYPKLLSFSVLTFIKWRLNTEFLANTLRNVVFRFKKAGHRYWKLINYALTWARPNLFLSIFMPVARMLQHGC